MATSLQRAEYYLEVIWCRDDRRLLDAFSRYEVTCEALHDHCCRYGVVRTIPGHVEEVGLRKKYGPHAKMLNCYVGKEITRTDAAEVLVLWWLVLLLGWMTYIRWYMRG